MLDESVEIEAGHRGLHSLLKKLALSQGPRERHRAIHELGARLVHHFRQEEMAGGFLDMVSETVPRHRDAVAQLRREHDVMREALRWLCTNVYADSELSPQASEKLHTLVRQLQDHEDVERRMLQDAVRARKLRADTNPPPALGSEPPPSSKSNEPLSSGPLLSNRLTDASSSAADDEADLNGVVDIDKLSVVFQPIIDMLTGVTFAHEVLVRCDVPGITPPVLFERAVEKKCTGLLGRLIREIAMEVSDGGRLFVNIHPHELNEEWLVRPDDPVYASDAEIFLEITESVPMSHQDLCMSVLKEVTSRPGIHVVVDDLGAGYSNLMHIARLEPSVVKLDRKLVMDIHKDRRQQLLVTAVVEMCVSLGAEVVAEGVETVDEYLTLLDTGVHYAQGYLFARPAYPLPPVNWPPV